MKQRFTAILLTCTAAVFFTAACTPTVQVAMPSEPININLNVKIDQEVRVRLEKDVENLIAENPDLF